MSKTIQQRQSPSAAKGLILALFSLLTLCTGSYAQTNEADVKTIAGTWIVKFDNGVDRVYKIAPDGHCSFTDSGGSKAGTAGSKNGELLWELSDRVFRFTKVSATTMRIEAWNPKGLFPKGKHSAGIAHLEVPAPSPVLKGEPRTQVPAELKQLVLPKGWDTPMQGGSSTVDDLARLLGPVASPKVDERGNDQILIYGNVPYLSPVRNALELLQIPNRLNSKVQLASSGFPRGAFFYYAVDGRFEGRFNRMYLIVDGADQVVSVQLVQESPRDRRIDSFPEAGWHTYNFVNTRTKAMNTLRIGHKVALRTQTRWYEYARPAGHAPEITKENDGWTVARVDSVLIQPAMRGSETELKEESRWYVPRPIVELILTCTKIGAR